MTEFAPEQYRALLRQDFGAFFHRVFLYLNPGEPFMPNWHIDLMQARLEQCRVGAVRRAIFNAPPRSMKSMCISVAYVAWALGHDPTMKFICISHSQDLADQLASDCLNVVSSNWYAQLFPQMRLASQRPAIANFKTTRNGGRFATSIGGSITGRGADVIIIDDPLKADQANSETERDRVNKWFGDTVYNRLNNKRTGCIIVVAHRLHVDDLVGHLQRQTHEKWEILSLPAIAEVPQTFEWETRFGKFTHRRAISDLLHPERESLELLNAVKETLGAATFAAQYQQNPVPVIGVMIREEWFKRYRDNELPAKFDLIMQSWDTANKPDDKSDYSVGTTWGIKAGLIFLLHVWRNQVGFPALKNAVLQQRELYRPGVILIEDMASGTQLIQELREAGFSEILGCKCSYDKVMRFQAQLALIQNGRVYLPEQAFWLAEYLDEVKTFPNSAHKDQVDSTTQALEWFRQLPKGWGGMEYWRNLAANLAKNRQKTSCYSRRKG